MKKRKTIHPLSIKDYTGDNPKPGAIPFVKKHHYFIIKNTSIDGDAPKDFISRYEYGRGRKNNPDSWPRYIAKHGHKHYPTEAITEHLLNRIGEVLGLNMAKSCLARLGGQIRFLSEYFLSNRCTQVLEHGADLYAGYLNDKDFVSEVENQNRSPEFFTVQFTQQTLRHFFPDHFHQLMSSFYLLLLFDAITGNNDRHYYNWGIVRDIRNSNPEFSPIYDSARGLYWNTSEKDLQDKYGSPHLRMPAIKKYAEHSYPKIGWDNIGKINHFDLIKHSMSQPDFPYKSAADILNNTDNTLAITNLINNEFAPLMSDFRRKLIEQTLLYRIECLKNVLSLHHE